jgi:hypothetical protein
VTKREYRPRRWSPLQSGGGQGIGSAASAAIGRLLLPEHYGFETARRDGESRPSPRAWRNVPFASTVPSRSAVLSALGIGFDGFASVS